MTCRLNAGFKMRFCWFIAVFIICTATIYPKDNHIIILRDGSEYRCTLKEITGDKVVFSVNGEVRTISRTDAAKISFNKQRLYDDALSIKDIKDNEILNSYKKSLTYKARADVPIVVFLNSASYTFKNGVLVEKVKFGFSITNESGKEDVLRYFVYNKKFSSGRLLYAATIDRNGAVYTTDESAINEEPYMNTAPQYDNIMRVKFGFPKPDIGSYFVYEYEITTDYNKKGLYDFKTEFTLADYEETLNKKATFTGFGDKLIYSFYAGETAQAKYKITKKNNFLEIASDNIAKIGEDEDNMPLDDYLVSRIDVGVKIDYAKISSFYGSYLDGLYNEEFYTNYLRSIPGLPHDKASKLQGIYNHVLLSKKRISAPLQQNGYLPGDPVNFGSYPGLTPLDKSALFVLLLRAAGYKAELCFVRSDDLSDVRMATPGVTNFNGVVVNVDGSGYFSFYKDTLTNYNLDDYFKNGDLLPLRVTGAGLSKLSLRGMEPAVNRRVLKCGLTGGDLKVTLSFRATGGGADALNGEMMLSTQEKLLIMKGRAAAYGPSSVYLGHKYGEEGSGEYTLDFVIKDFVNKSGKLSFIKIPGIKPDMRAFARDKREYSFKFDSLTHEIIEAEITLPEDKKAEAADSEVAYNEAGVNLRFSVRNEPGKIKIVYNNDRDVYYMNGKQYSGYRNAYQQIAALIDRWIIIGGRSK